MDYTMKRHLLNLQADNFIIIKMTQFLIGSEMRSDSLSINTVIVVSLYVFVYLLLEDI